MSSIVGARFYEMIFIPTGLRPSPTTSVAANDAPSRVIMVRMRHARFDTTKRYIRQAERFTKNAARMAGL